MRNLLNEAYHALDLTTRNGIQRILSWQISPTTTI
jgi:hypothetical protein